MKRRGILSIICLALIAMTACGDKAGEENSMSTENSAAAENNAAAEAEQTEAVSAEGDSEDRPAEEVNIEEINSEEKNPEEVNLAELDVYWSLDGQEYDVLFTGNESDDCYRILLEDESGLKELLTYPRYEDSEPSDFQAGLFEDVCGCEGFYLYDMTYHFVYGYYYAVDQGEAVKIADNWGAGVEDTYVVDVDGDGVTELICNVMYGDGAMDTVIYHRTGNKIVTGSCSDLLDEEYDNLSYASSYARYVPEEEMVEIYYWIEEIDGFKSKKYEIDLDKIKYWSEVAFVDR